MGNEFTGGENVDLIVKENEIRGIPNIMEIVSAFTEAVPKKNNFENIDDFIGEKVQELLRWGDNKTSLFEEMKTALQKEYNFILPLTQDLTGILSKLKKIGVSSPPQNNRTTKEGSPKGRIEIFRNKYPNWVKGKN